MQQEEYVYSLCAKIQERFDKRIVGSYADKYSVSTAVAEAHNVKPAVRKKLKDLVAEAITWQIISWTQNILSAAMLM